MTRSNLLKTILALAASWFPQFAARAEQPLLSAPAEPLGEPVAAPVAHEPAPEPAHEPTRSKALGARGATPIHYRAFSVLGVRLKDQASADALAAFRTRVKTIKLQDSQIVRDQALALLDHFASLADQYAPLHDDVETDEAIRMRRRATMFAAVVKLDAALADILASADRSDLEFESAVRFIDLRYETAASADAADYGLTSI